MKAVSLTLFIMLLVAGGCKTQPANQPDAGNATASSLKTTLLMDSPAFANGGKIPERYSCDGENVSPALQWRVDTPDSNYTFVLTCDDPDAPRGDWVHWVVYDIPGNVTRIEEDSPPTDQFADGMKQGKNDFGDIGWGGPCPPGAIRITTSSRSI